MPRRPRQPIRLSATQFEALSWLAADEADRRIQSRAVYHDDGFGTLDDSGWRLASHYSRYAVEPLQPPSLTTATARALYQRGWIMLANAEGDGDGRAWRLSAAGRAVLEAVANGEASDPALAHQLRVRAWERTATRLREALAQATYAHEASAQAIVDALDPVDPDALGPDTLRDLSGLLRRRRLATTTLAEAQAALFAHRASPVVAPFDAG